MANDQLSEAGPRVVSNGPRPWPGLLAEAYKVGPVTGLWSGGQLAFSSSCPNVQAKQPPEGVPRNQLGLDP